MRITFESTGNFEMTEEFLKKVTRGDYLRILSKYAKMGVNALSNATPLDSGITASSWEYKVTGGDSPSIEWYNTNNVNGLNVVILLQYGHGVRGGGYVQGRDFINPAIQPIFDKIANEVWRELTK